MLDNAVQACASAANSYAIVWIILTVSLAIVGSFLVRYATRKEIDRARTASFSAIFKNIKGQIAKSQILAQKGRHEQAIYDLRDVIDKNIGRLAGLFITSSGATPLTRILSGPPPIPQIKLCKAGDCTCEPGHHILLEATGPRRDNHPFSQVTPAPVTLLPAVRRPLTTAGQRKFQELIGDTTLFVDVHIDEPDPKRLFVCDCEKGKCQDLPKTCCPDKPFDRVNYPKEYPAWVDDVLSEFDAFWREDFILSLLQDIHTQLTTTKPPLPHS